MCWHAHGGGKKTGGRRQTRSEKGTKVQLATLQKMVQIYIVTYENDIFSRGRVQAAYNNQSGGGVLHMYILQEGGLQAATGKSFLLSVIPNFNYKLIYQTFTAICSIKPCVPFVLLIYFCLFLPSFLLTNLFCIVFHQIFLCICRYCFIRIFQLIITAFAPRRNFLFGLLTSYLTFGYLTCSDRP